MTITMTRKQRIEQQKMEKKAKSRKVLPVALAAVVSVSSFANVNAVNAEDCDCMKYAGAHFVESGDTYYSIAKKYGLKTQQLMDANMTASTHLFIGQEVLLPDPSMKWVGDNPVPKVETPKKALLEFSKGSHQVTKGDTLYAISRKYGVSMSELKSINSLKTDTIKVGQILELDADKFGKPVYPSKQEDVLKAKNGVTKSSAASYIVQKGDTLFSLKKRFGSALNHTDQNIKVGQKLALKGQITTLITSSPVLLADGRVMEVKVNNEFFPVYVTGGNHKFESFAYKTDKVSKVIVVKVDQRLEVVSFTQN